MFQVALSLQDLIEVVQYDLFKDNQAQATIRHEPLFQAPTQCLDFPYPHTGSRAATKRKLYRLAIGPDHYPVSWQGETDEGIWHL